ncbi:hypothetical protein SKTS_19450 [Sulfurimicrobium lacus]|uniref:Large polyvalent protein associated domain-containing protein n=1 Tax=Sulfurimicrobium lacus TaxID=2715678 RepID=A0A6F8VEA8_9PROT|nr:hypothetical protein [Sulfurimicrobium lacus]BCB27059.1 hypothetical protein SKTS_19450 [Sulfurimicrobium lacus]
MSNEFDAAVAAAMQPDQGQAARVGFSAASDTNPDAFAEAQRVARRTGVPVDTVINMPKEMKRQDAAGSIDFDAMAKTSPATASLLGDIEKAKIAHDNVDNLVRIEETLRPITRSARSALAGATFDLSSGAYGLLETGLKFIAPLGDPLAGTLLPENPLRRVASGFEDWRKGQAALADTVAGDQTGAGFIEQGINSGFRSFGQMAPGIAGTVMTGNPAFALGSAGAMQGSQSATKALDAGKSPLRALAYGAEDAAAEVATEMIPMGLLLKDLKAGAPLFRVLGHQIATEVPTEMTATAWQNFNEWANLNPDKPFSTYLEALPAAEAQTVIATITTSVLTAGMGKGVHAVANRMQQNQGKAQQASQNAELLGSLNQLAAYDKLLQRDAPTFEQFVAHAAEGGPVQQVFIDANTLMQSGVAEQVAAASPAVAAQLSDALQTGGQISIPIEEYTARIAPTEYAQSLIDHIKTDPEGFSRAEAQEYMQNHAEEMQAEVERTLTDKNGNDTFKASADVVRAEIKTQLDTAARFTPQVNDAYSAMVGNFYAVTAAKLGMTPEGLFQRYPLRIGAERVDGLQFDQADTPDTPDALLTAFDNADEISIEAPKASEQEIDDAQHLFLSAFPENATLYRRKSGVLSRIRQASDRAANELGGKAETARSHAGALGPFSAYQIEGEELPPDSFNPNGLLTVRVFGKEQVEAGLTQEPALTFAVSRGGELTVNGPSPSGETFAEFQKRGWADLGRDAKGEPQPGWSTLKDPNNPGKPLPISQITPLLADVHARVRAWRMEGYVGLHWSRATGALGGLPGMLNENGTAVFFQDKKTPRGAFNPASLSITLLKGADLSTFLHESGHFFMEVHADLAAKLQQDAESFGLDTLEPGERQIIADTDALLHWFGVRDLTTWHALNFEEKRAYHEQFARGFEAYLFEGKAPSIELQGLFQRFRAWMLSLYKELKALNVELTPEVRGVFDRMLATGEQITLAEQGRSMMPLFTSPEQAGMTPDEFAAYQALGVDATNDAIQDLQARGLRDMAWLHNARGRVVKQLQKEAKAKRDEVHIDIRREVMSQPIYRAWQFLTGKEVEGGEPVGRLDAAAVRELDLPEAVSKRLRDFSMLRTEGGLHPDTVAEMFGFTSGDELVRKLAHVETPKAEIDALTDVRMLEQFGDLSSHEAIERAADKAIHNDARARFVATEANALAKATGQRRVLASAAKEYAAAMIARLKVRNIKPGQYANAEVRAAKTAEKASKAGDLVTAAAEKRNQLIQGYATRAAYDAQDEVDKGLRYLKKFEGDIKNLDADYAEQIGNMLERFDLRKGQSNKAVDKRTALAEWIRAQREAGLEPDIPRELENEAFRTSYKNLTVEEFRGVIDTVRQIEHLGRLKHKLLTAADQRAYEVVRDGIAASIHAHARDREADTRTPTTNMGRAVQGLKRFWAAHIKVATWARVMDGGKDGGPVWEYFVRNANVAGDRETTMRAEATARLSEIIAPVFKLGKMGGKGQFFPSVNRSLNREARIAIALNMGNEGNMQRLLGGEGWTMAQLTPVLQSMTAQEWQAVQAVWDHFETYRPQIAAKERRIYGKEPEWVEPQPFAVTTADGATVTLRGGYYPIKYDPAASQRAEEHADAESAKRQLQGAYTTATTRRSFTKARVDEVQGRPLLYTLSGLYSGVNDVIHDLAWHEWLIDTNRLLRSHTIDAAIRKHYGPEAKQQFKTWAQDIAEGEKGADAAVDLALSRLRQGVSVAGLGFNVMSALIQPLGITQSVTRVGAEWVGRGVLKYVAHPIDLTRTVNEMSDLMANRARTRFRELNELRNQVQDQTAFKELTGRYAYFLMMRCQQMVDVPTWWGAYEKAIAEGNGETRAVSLADQAVIDAQGGGQTKDLSAIERGGPSQKLFTVFYSFMNTALNIGVDKTMGAGTPAKRAKLAVDYAMLYVLPAILGYFLKAALTPGDSGDDDPEKLAKKLIANQIDYLMGLMVVAREFSGAAKSVAGVEDFGRAYSGPAGARVVSDAYSLAIQTNQGEFDDAFRKAAVNTIGGLFGLPSAQINRTTTGIEALSGGKTNNPAAVVFGFQEKR